MQEGIGCGGAASRAAWVRSPACFSLGKQESLAVCGLRLGHKGFVSGSWG